MPKTENLYQHELIEKLKVLFPGCIVLKNDSSYIQGIPDLTVLYADQWLMLEVKKSATAPYRPNQEYYLEQTDSMSMSWTIFPENEEEVLDAIQRSFEAGRCPRIFGS